MPPCYKVSKAHSLISQVITLMFLNPFYISLLTQITVLIKIIQEKSILTLICNTVYLIGQICNEIV